MSADMSPYCSAHDEWLIMKLCMYVGYHTANNVSNFGGDSIKLKKSLKHLIFHFVFQNMRSAGLICICGMDRYIINYTS